MDLRDVYCLGNLILLLFGFFLLLENDIIYLFRKLDCYVIILVLDLFVVYFGIILGNSLFKSKEEIYWYISVKKIFMYI